MVGFSLVSLLTTPKQGTAKKSHPDERGYLAAKRPFFL